ncbi:hypothetical protein VPH35_098709 [Triticum aestivum]
MPLVAAPPCLVHCPRRFAFAHLQNPDPNPTPLIRRAIQHTCGNPSFIMGGSWRGIACLSFHTPATRNDVISHSPIEFEGNVVTIEPVEHVDRSIAIFTDLAEVEVSEFPHELWHEDAIRFALAFLGDVCDVDDFCLHGIDYTSVRALVLLQSGKPAPPGIIIQLPPINEIKIAKVVELSRWHHGDGATPFGSGGSALASPLPPPGTMRQPLIISDDSSAASEDMHAPLLHGVSSDSPDVVHAPPLAEPTPPVTRPTPQVGSVAPPNPCAGPAAAPLLVGPLMPSSSSAFAAVIPPAGASAGPTTFTFSAGESSCDAALPLQDLDTHECTIRWERRKTTRDQSVSKDKLRRSARLAGKEAKYSPMLARAVKAKAARLSASDVGTAIDRAIQEARLHQSDAPPASAEDLAAIALLCGTNDGQVDAILGSEASASGGDEAP